MSDLNEMVHVRYMVDDVEKAVAFYTEFLGFEVLNAFPPFADIARGRLRLLLSGPMSSAGRAMPDGAKPGPGGWNRIHLLVDDIEAEVARLRSAGATFRNDLIEGPGGKQILVAREALAAGKVQRSFALVRLDTFAVLRQAGEPEALGAFQRWQDPSWRQHTVAMR